MKKVIAIDLDDTTANFLGSEAFKDGFDVTKMYEKGFFLNLPPMAGALSGVRSLMRMGYDVHILTQPVAESAHSYSEKVQWIGLHFPELIGKIHMTQEKGMFRAEFLIDDNAAKWKEKFEAEGGTFVMFDHHVDHQKEWTRIVDLFKNHAEKYGTEKGNVKTSN